MERYDYWEGERYLEVLAHDRDSVDLTRASEGLPLLTEHTSRDLVGIVEDVQVGGDRVLRGWARFSRSQRGQEVRQDVLDGIRKSISAGYWPDEGRASWSEKDPATGVRTKTYSRWTPLEASLVAIPADPSVGVGRSADGAPTPRETQRTESGPGPEERTMEGTNQAATAATVGADSEARERQRAQEVADVMALAARHGMAERASQLIGSGSSVAQVQREILVELSKDARSGVSTAPPEPTGVVELTEKETKRYSLLRAMRGAAGWESRGFEHEVSEEIAKRIGRDPNGFYMPTNLKQDRTLAVKEATKGKEIVFEEYGGFIDLLRNRMVTTQLGATVLTGLQGDVRMPKQTGAGTFVWMAESSGTDVTKGTATIGAVKLSPKTGMARTHFSRQLLAQGSVDAENLVRNDLINVGALGVDLAALHGTGADNQPTGIYTAAGVNAVAFDGVINYADVVKMETEIVADNADFARMGYAVTPEVRGAAKTTQVFSGTNGAPLFTGGVSDGEMNGYRALASNQLRKNLGSGTDEHAAIFGAWEHLFIGEWGAADIMIDPYTLSGQGDVRVILYLLVDVAIRYPESFCKATGLVPVASGS